MTSPDNRAAGLPDQLHAYLDDALTPAERAALDAALSRDPALRAELDALRATRDLLRALPTLRSPRDLRLTPAMVRPTPAAIVGRFSPWLSAAAAFLLIAVGVLTLTRTPAIPPSTLNVAAAPTVMALATSTAAPTVTLPPVIAPTLALTAPPDARLLTPPTPAGDLLDAAGLAADAAPQAAEAAALSAAAASSPADPAPPAVMQLGGGIEPQIGAQPEMGLMMAAETPPLTPLEPFASPQPLATPAPSVSEAAELPAEVSTAESESAPPEPVIAAPPPDGLIGLGLVIAGLIAAALTLVLFRARR